MKGRGSLLHGGSLYFSFHQKRSKLGIFLQTDANNAEMKKKDKIFDSAPCYRTLFLQWTLMIKS
jgi:hypothetical protein